MEKILLVLSEFRAEIKTLFAGAKSATEQAAADQKSILDLKGQLEAKDKVIAERDGTIKDLQGKLDAATGQVTAKENEVKTVQGQLEAETKRVDETLSAMGVDPKKIPAPAKPGGPGTAGNTLTEQYNAITDSKKRAEFRRKNIVALAEEERSKTK